MLWLPKRVRIINWEGEDGRVVLAYVGRRLVIDVYRWPGLRFKAWRMPDVGVLVDVRVGWFELQIRRRC